MKLPDFPWDALAPYGERAKAHPSGFIDLSVGTPVDPTPEFIQNAFKLAANSPNYPLTAGTPELRDAISKWAQSQLGATGEFAVLPVIGSKELVAWLPTILESTHVLYPEIAYPTYLVGSMIAKTKSTTVDFDASTWPTADLAWVNTPSNPTGRVHSDSELISTIEWARKGGVVVADECYLEFGDGISPKSILSLTGGNNKNILAIHSLSKRSSIAGYRAAMMIGDKDLRIFQEGFSDPTITTAIWAQAQALGHADRQRSRGWSARTEEGMRIRYGRTSGALPDNERGR